MSCHTKVRQSFLVNRNRIWTSVQVVNGRLTFIFLQIFLSFCYVVVVCFSKWSLLFAELSNLHWTQLFNDILFANACTVSCRFSTIPIRYLSSLQGHFNDTVLAGGQFPVCISILNANKWGSHLKFYRWAHLIQLKAISILNGSAVPLASSSDTRISTLGVTFIQTPSISWAQALNNITNILNLLRSFLF